MYIELFLIDNTIINFYILYLSGAFLKIKINKFLGIFCGFFGAIYGFFQLQGYLNSFLLKILLSVAMVITCYFKHKTLYTRLIIMFYCISFAFGGLCFSLMYVTKGTPLLGRALSLPIPFRYAFFIIIFGTFIRKYLFSIITYIRYNKQDIKIFFTILDEPFTLNAYSDTGNNCDYFNTPVIFANKAIFKNIFDLDESFSNNLSTIENINITYIPYTVAGNTDCLSPAVLIKNANFTFGQNTITKKCYIALVQNDFNGCDCLVNPKIFE